MERTLSPGVLGAFSVVAAAGWLLYKWPYVVLLPQAFRQPDSEHLANLLVIVSPAVALLLVAIYGFLIEISGIHRRSRKVPSSSHESDSISDSRD